MRTPTRLAVVSALGIFGMSGANASIVTATTAGGSEAVLTIVNTATNATISQDLGEQLAAINSGDTYSLSAASQSFISGAGGLANVAFAVIAGATTTRTYLTSSADASLDTLEIANSERNVWAGTLNNMLPTLNSGDASATSVNNTYGPFNTGVTGNYVDGGWDLWNGSYVVNTGAGDADLFLWRVVFGTNNLQNAAITSFLANPADSYARLSATTLQIGPLSAVPVPAAVWLFGSGLGLLGVLRRRTGR